MYNLVLNAYPAHPAASLGLATVLHRQKRSKAALPHVANALRSWPKSTPVLQLYGQLFQATDMHSAAVTAAEVGVVAAHQCATHSANVWN